jgi:hypothetical protein
VSVPVCAGLASDAADHLPKRISFARAPAFVDPPGYARHRPETTLLYQLVEQHYLAFRELRAAAGRPLPDYVEAEFDACLKCGRLEEGFLRLRCEQCHAEWLVAFSCKKRGLVERDAGNARLSDEPAQDEGGGRSGAPAGGFSPHAGLDLQPGVRAKLERLRRYVSRPPLEVERLALAASGQVRYKLKTPYRDGTTPIVLAPLAAWAPPLQSALL